MGWKPSKSKAREFAKQMAEINEFCYQHGINQSRNQDSYYFCLNGKYYRVSNHSIEMSNAYSNSKYHEEERRDDTIYIHASKTRIIEIYNNLKKGYKLDGRGFRIV